MGTAANRGASPKPARTMLRRKLTRRLTVWLTLVAMLFSALSPAMASVLFAHRPDVMARVLALPAPGSSVAGGIVCHSPDVLGGVLSPTASQSDESSNHTAHGIFCAFCLNASAGFALPASVACGDLTFVVPKKILPAPRAPLPAQAPVSNYRSRAPPVVS